MEVLYDPKTVIQPEISDYVRIEIERIKQLSSEYQVELDILLCGNIERDTAKINSYRYADDFIGEGSLILPDYNHISAPEKDNELDEIRYSLSSINLPSESRGIIRALDRLSEALHKRELPEKLSGLEMYWISKGRIQPITVKEIVKKRVTALYSGEKIDHFNINDFQNEDLLRILRSSQVIGYYHTHPNYSEPGLSQSDELALSRFKQILQKPTIIAGVGISDKKDNFYLW